MARIADLLAPFVPHRLTQHQFGQISSYLDLLVRWNARINLTSVRDPEHIVTRHIGESLFAAAALFPHPDAQRIARPALATAPSAAAMDNGSPPVAHLIDVGSGAGFPGLPIKIWAPAIHLTLIESNHKKVAFLREAVRATALMNVDVFAGRAEDYSRKARELAPALSAGADVVTLRAIERFDVILPLAARLIAPAGRLALLIGASQVSAATSLPGFAWHPPILIPQSAARVLLIGSRRSEPNF